MSACVCVCLRLCGTSEVRGLLLGFVGWLVCWCEPVVGEAALSSYVLWLLVCARHALRNVCIAVCVLCNPERREREVARERARRTFLVRESASVFVCSCGAKNTL